jgi:hypothetical protein
LVSCHCCGVDTTQATASDQIKDLCKWCFAKQHFQQASYPSQNYQRQSGINTTSIAFRLGAYNFWIPRSYYDGLMALPILVDGAALDPTSFGELDDDGYWNPIEFTNILDLIPFGEGTAFGNMTAHAALSTAFDGNYSHSGSSGVAIASGPGYIGKQWPSAKTITGFRVYSYTDVGFMAPSNPTVTFTLYGSNSSPATATDGTSLFTGTMTDGSGLTIFSAMSGITTSSAYDYHWVTISTGSNVHVGEVEFYEDSATAGYGTNGFAA